jgi:hypothetical protein
MGRRTGLGTGWLCVTLRYILYRPYIATRGVRSSQREEFSSHPQKTLSVIRMCYLPGVTGNRFSRWVLNENGDNYVEPSSWVAKWINQSLLLERGCVRRFGEQMEFCLRDIYEIFLTLCHKVSIIFKSRSVNLKYFCNLYFCNTGAYYMWIGI